VILSVVLNCIVERCSRCWYMPRADSC